jgi:RNase adaptor protein for sRNA GlmZ degradation
MKAFAFTFALLAFGTAAQAQSDPWDGLENKGARYAGTKDDRQNAVIFVCPVTGAPQLIVRSPQFRVSVPDDHRYTLTFATDRGRSELTAVAKDAELTFDASDINAQVLYQRLAEDIAASKSFSISMSPFGWKGQFTAEGAAEALKPMLAGCRG